MVRDCFADQVFIDYGSISDPTGSPDVGRDADEWLKVLQGVINGFDITRHAISNHRVTISDGVVNCRAYLSADHIIFPEKTRERLIQALMMLIDKKESIPDRRHGNIPL